MTTSGGATATAATRPATEETVREAVRAAIEDRRLAPGTRLVEEQLAGVFNVSRARVRTALRELARDHLVEVRRNRGACVAAPSPAEAREVFQARRLLEDAVVRALARSCPADAPARLRAHVAAEETAHAAGDRSAGIRLSGAFHLLLAELLGNGIVTAMLRDLVARSSLIIALYEQRPAPCCGADEHARLIQALETGAEAEAAADMERHLRTIEDRLVLADRRDAPMDLRAVFMGA